MADSFFALERKPSEVTLGRLYIGICAPGRRVKVALILIPLVLAALILWGLVVWSRGSRRLLVATDAVVTLGCWSVFLMYVFANDLPLVALALSPMALILAAVAPHPRPGSRSSAEASV